METEHHRDRIAALESEVGRLTHALTLACDRVAELEALLEEQR